LSDILSTELVCSLKHVSSFQQEQYDALSYSWGTQSPSLEDAHGERIKLNGRWIWIQPNLAAALYKLRHPKERRTLWVDALCINQMDPLEKATQVPLMREIYANAQQVIIWLGKESNSDRHAFEHLNWLFNLFDQRGDVLGMNHDESDNDLWWAQVKVEKPDVFKSLVALLSRQWFRRTWVVQEVASSQTAVLKCGDASIEWDVVSDVLTRLRYPLFALDHTEDTRTQRSLANISAMENARRSVNGTSTLSLFEILLDTCSNDCTEPKDKIFAVLGLAKDWLEKGGLVPDYRFRTTTEDIFRRFAMWDVKTNGKIRILSCVTGRDKLTNLPSWAPDWRKIRNSRPFVRYSGRTLFSASGDTNVDAWYSDHGQTLNTIGEVVDSVEVLGSEPQHSKSVFTSVNGGIEVVGLIYIWLKECQKLAANTQGRMTEDRFEQFWRTMTCGLTAEALPAPNVYGRYFMDYMKLIESKVRREIEGIAGMGIGRIGGISGSDFGGNFYGIMARHDDNDSDGAANALIEGSLNMWSSKRRFCTTSRGRLACVPEGAETGDLICILYGGEVPYVLRPQRNGYNVVVGECYVDGIMYGEACSGQSSWAKHFRLV